MTWGTGLTLVALVLALVQMIQVGRISTATHDALNDFASKIGNYRVMAIVPQLTMIERDCQLAADDGDVSKVLDALRRWHEAAGSLKGYLTVDDPEAEKMLTQITASLSAATAAKGKLVDSTEDPVSSTKSIRKRMNDVCASASEVAARLQVQVTPARRPRTLPEIAKGAFSNFKVKG